MAEPKQAVDTRAVEETASWMKKSKQIVGLSLVTMFVVVGYLFLVAWQALPEPDTGVYELVTTTQLDTNDASEVSADAAAAAVTVVRERPASPDKLTLFFGSIKRQVALDLDVLYIVVVGLAGSMGSITFGLRSFTRWSATNWKPDWIYWYLLHPAIGMALAVGVYMLLRGGLVSVSASSSDINAYGMVGLGFLVGFASRHLARWLQHTAQAMFPADEAARGSKSDDDEDQAEGDSDAGDGSDDEQDAGDGSDDEQDGGAAAGGGPEVDGEIEEREGPDPAGRTGLVL